jgi:hypothetical protein
MYEEILTLISAILGLAAIFYGAKYQGAKGKVGKYVDLLTKVTNVATTAYDAAKDDKITEEEFQKIADATQEVVNVAKESMVK